MMCLDFCWKASKAFGQMLIWGVPNGNPDTHLVVFNVPDEDVEVNENVAWNWNEEKVEKSNVSISK